MHGVTRILCEHLGTEQRVYYVNILARSNAYII